MCVPKQPEQAVKDVEDRCLWGQIRLDFQRSNPVVIRKREAVKTDEDNASEYRYNR